VVLDAVLALGQGEEPELGASIRSVGDPCPD
jgi:hypothetical protein